MKVREYMDNPCPVQAGTRGGHFRRIRPLPLVGGRIAQLNLRGMELQIVQIDIGRDEEHTQFMVPLL